MRRDDFGYGRVPASSACCESEFNRKNIFIKKKYLRADLFIQNHVKYLSGKFKVIEASCQTVVVQPKEDIQWGTGNNHGIITHNEERLVPSNNMECQARWNGGHSSGVHTSIVSVGQFPYWTTVRFHTKLVKGMDKER